MAEIFISHSRRGESQLGWLRSLFGGTGVKAVSREFDDYLIPHWADIAADIERSKAVFLLLTPKVESSSHASNWVNFEVIKAVSSNKPLWILEEVERPTTFPIPGLPHNVVRYLPYSRAWPELDDYIRQIICGYEEHDIQGTLALGITGAPIAIMSDHPEMKAREPMTETAIREAGLLGPLPQPPRGLTIHCPYPHCGVQFELHARLEDFACPSCRQGIHVPSLAITEEQPCVLKNHYYF